jgi:hypothetical protein
MPLCAQCGTPFNPRPRAVRQGQGRFCSGDCVSRSRRAGPELTCAHCGKTFYRPPSGVSRSERPFCGKPCADAGKTPPPEARFWPKVAIGPGCWIWTGKVRKNGYGAIQINGRGGYAHRFSWELHFGAIPKGHSVCHTCDNPACVRPDHLFVGTTADNNSDMWRKDRGRHGEHHPCSKLTAEDVREIRRLVAAGVRRSEIADRFGITRNHLVKIASGRSWKRV